MWAKNVYQLQLPFTINYQGNKYVIPYDNQLHEVPDGCVDPNGVRGYLQLYKANPVVPPQSFSNLLEIDLSTLPIYKAENYENYEEETIKRENEVKQSIEETIELAQRNRRAEDKRNSTAINQEDNQEVKGTISEDTEFQRLENPLSISEVVIEESTEVNSLEDLLSPLEKKPAQPLKGKRIPKNVANRGIKSRINSKKKRPSKDSNCVTASEKK